MTDAPLALRRSGDRGVLVEPADADGLSRLRGTLTGSLPEGVTDWIVGARTILLTLDAPTELATLARELEHRMSTAMSAGAAPVASVLEIPVRYDGPDLAEVAALLSMTPAEVIAAHTAIEWECRFIGFAPGFGYLEPVGDSPFELPRRAQARTVVPAGSVALADRYSAVYPRRSPGGWQLIGTTDLPVWDEQRQPPNLVSAGRRIRFVSIG